jgi:uncharacterized protein (UPF0276 family)
MRQPKLSHKLGLGFGLDLPWGAPIGFRCDPASGDRAPDSVVRCLNDHRRDLGCFFASWQPKNRNRLDAREYFDAYDDLFGRMPRWLARTLHQTSFNLGALEPYDRGAIVEMTNALIERYGLLWVNEDLGLWSIRGRPLPYPLPPYLTKEGLRAAVRNTEEVQARLVAPLVVEFPGFSFDTSLVVGNLHAYDYFRTVVEETGSPATLDVGHLLSYQWLRGKRGNALYEDLERLPLAHCIEIHLSGSAIADDRFMDLHHGILVAEQFALLERLLTRCANLRVVTFEDPRLDERGSLDCASAESFRRLRAVTSRWAA